MQKIAEYSLEQLKKWMVDEGFKSFNAKQVFEWIYQKKVFSFDKMTNLSNDLREGLKFFFVLPSLKLLQTEVAKDQQTIKFLFCFEDGKKVESVLILSDKRRTVCVSSQVGCPAKCAFCASGKEGLFRNLECAEILEQVLFIDQYLKEKGERVSHIVFMGMGEPLENYDNVVKTIKCLISKDRLGISQRRITVSTVGVVENILRLQNESFVVNLVLSLHAPNQHIRKKIIPYARKYPLEDVLKAVDTYSKNTKRDITYEYTLIENVNDKLEHAKELSHLLKKKHCCVNIIPYNPVLGINLRRPQLKAIQEFVSELQNSGIVTTWRYTKGKDIQAACGQLAVIK